MTQLTKLNPEIGRRESAKATNRQAILAAARVVFARMGYGAASIRDIIRETDLASGTFYNYFESKEQVFEAVASESVLRFRPLLQDVRASASDLESYLRAAYRAYFQFLEQENLVAIEQGTPHLALIGVRIDTPEMQAVSDEIRHDLERVLVGSGLDHIDTDYLTAAAIGIAREMGDHMLKRRPIDADAASLFATQLVMAGIAGLSVKD